MTRALAIAVLAVVAWCAGGAGSLCWADPGDAVEVTFTDRSTRSLGPGEARPAKSVLTEHLIALGKQGLAAGQHLQVDVIRLDLAGHLIFPRGQSEAVRLLDGRSDWPRIELHYVLSTPGGVVQQGDDTLTDMNYLDRGPQRDADQPYPYEKRLLTQWFRRTFAGASSPTN